MSILFQFCLFALLLLTHLSMAQFDQFAAFTLFLNSLNGMSVKELRAFFQSPLAGTLSNALVNSLSTGPGSQFTLRSNYTLDRIIGVSFDFIVKNGFTDPIASPDELGYCDFLPRANISCYCSAFKYDSQALYWTNPAIRARIDQIGSISAFGQNICYQVMLFVCYFEFNCSLDFEHYY